MFAAYLTALPAVFGRNIPNDYPSYAVSDKAGQYKCDGIIIPFHKKEWADKYLMEAH